MQPARRPADRPIRNLDRSGMADKRHAPRQRALKSGKIILNGGGSVFDCLVRNLSETGALLEIASSVGVPDLFELVIGQAPTQRTLQARVVRREATRLGVTFDGDV
jgi:hypothetical protein